MMKNILLLIIIISLFMNNCFAPINLTYESATTVNKGEVEVQGNYSRYYAPSFNASDSININNNFGFKIGYGVCYR